MAGKFPPSLERDVPTWENSTPIDEPTPTWENSVPIDEPVPTWENPTPIGDRTQTPNFPQAQVARPSIPEIPRSGDKRAMSLYGEALDAHVLGNRELAKAKAEAALSIDKTILEARNLLNRYKSDPMSGTVRMEFTAPTQNRISQPPPGQMMADLKDIGKGIYESVDQSPILRTIGAGNSRLMAQAARVPNLASNIFVLPYNATLNVTGRNDLAIKSPRLFEKEAKWWDEKASQISEGFQRWDAKGETFQSVIKRKDAKEISRYLAYKVLEQAPQQAIVIGAAALGAPAAALAYMGASSAAQAQSEGEDSSASPAEITANAVGNGMVEAALEQTPALMGKWGKALSESIGTKNVKTILKNVFKMIASSIVQEGPVEEGGTELLQSLSSKMTGVNPDAMNGVLWRMAEASAVGGAMGAGMTAPAAIGIGINQAGRNVAPIDIPAESEYPGGYETIDSGGRPLSVPPTPTPAISPELDPGNLADAVRFVPGTQTEELSGVPGIVEPVAPMAEQATTPVPPSERIPQAQGQQVFRGTVEQQAASQETNVPKKTSRLRVIPENQPEVSDRILAEFEESEQPRVKSLASSLRNEAVAEYNIARDRFQRWREIIGRGIMAPKVIGTGRDVLGEYNTLPIWAKNNTGEDSDIVAADAVEAGLITDPKDIFQAIRSLKAPKRPSNHPDSYIQEVVQILEEERAFEQESKNQPPDMEYDAQEEPPFIGNAEPIPFESRSPYGSREQGELFNAPRENVGQAFDRIVARARSQGMDIPQAVRYAKKVIASQQRGQEQGKADPGMVQSEMGTGGGVYGFGDGRRGESSLFETQGEFGDIMEMTEGTTNAKKAENILPGSKRKDEVSVIKKAPFELRYEKTGSLTFPGSRVSGPEDVAFAFRSLQNQPMEHVYILAMKGLEPIGIQLHTIGAISEAGLYAFEISTFLTGVGADGFYWIHNHPSGNPTPSPEDRRSNNLLSTASEKIGIKMHGGIVINDTQFGFLPPEGGQELKTYPNIKEGNKSVDVLRPYMDWSGPKQKSDEWLVNTPERAFALTKGIQLDKNAMMALFLNAKNQLMAMVSMPKTRTDTLTALAGKYRSIGIILACQTGQSPNADVIRRLNDTLKSFGVSLLDVVESDKEGTTRPNGTGFTSMRNSGRIFESPGKYFAREESPYLYQAEKIEGDKAVLPNGGYVPLSRLSKLQRFYREWLTTERGVGKTIDRLNEERIGKIMETAFDSPLTGKELLKYFKKNPSEDLRQAVFDALTGKREIESLPSEIVPTVKKMRADVDALSRAVAAGATPNDNLRIAIERNFGRYIGRYYKLFERKQFRPAPEVIERAKSKMRELNPSTLGKASDSELNGIIENILSKGDATFHRGDRRIDIPQNHFIKRKNMPKEIRDLYGEITDPVWAYLKTMSDQSVVAHNAEFLDKIKNIENGFKDKPTTTHYKQIPDTARWGAVRGKYTTPEINDFLIEAIDPVDSGLFRFVEKLIVNPFKWTKTVASLPSHPRNLLGNTMFSILGSNSITNPMNVPYYWKALKVIMGREGAYRDTWKELVRARVADTQYWGSEMPKMMAEMISDPTDWPNKILDKAKWPIEKLGSLYNNEDLIYRVSAFLKYRDSGMTVNQAAAEVDKWFTNYARLPKAVKTARRIGVFGPFLSFKANTARILTTAAKEAADGMKKGNPAPAMRLAFVLSFISAFALAMRKIFDVDDDEMKKLQNLGPVYKRNSTPIYYRADDNKIKAFDLGYIWPTGEFQKASKAALAGDVESFVDSIDLFQHPLFDVYSVIFNNYNTRTSRNVSNQNDPLPRQTADKMAELARQIYVPASSPIPSIPGVMRGKYEPGLLTGYQIKALYDAFNGVQDRFGKTREVPEELRAFMTGIRTWTINPDDVVLAYKIRKSAEINEAKREATRYLRMKSITPEEREKRLGDLRRRIEKIRDDIKKAGAIKIE